MKNKLSVFVLLLAITVPQVAFASWWNPLSWKVFSRIFSPNVETVQEVVPTENVASSTDEVSEIEKLKAELEELKSQKNDSGSPKTAPTTQTTTKQNTPAVNSTPAPQTTTKTMSRDEMFADVMQKYTNFQSTITNKKGGLKKNSSSLIERNYYVYLDGLLNKIYSDLGYLESIKNWNSRPLVEETYLTKYKNLKSDYDTQSRSYSADINNEQQTNYYTDAMIRLNAIISHSESFNEWLNDTSEQLRTTVMLIANKPYTGGLIGECRTASVDFGNSLIEVVSSTKFSVQEDINKWKMLRDYLNSNSSEFVGKDDLNAIPTIDYVKNDYSKTRSEINEDLSSVTKGMGC